MLGEPGRKSKRSGEMNWKFGQQHAVRIHCDSAEESDCDNNALRKQTLTEKSDL